MNKKLTREEKEILYDKEMNELQRLWKNPIDDENTDFSDLTDEQLDKGLEDTIGQLKFERGLSFIKKLFLYPIYIFIALGIVGLLIFGIKQIF